MKAKLTKVTSALLSAMLVLALSSSSQTGRASFAQSIHLASIGTSAIEAATRLNRRNLLSFESVKVGLGVYASLGAVLKLTSSSVLPGLQGAMLAQTSVLLGDRLVRLGSSFLDTQVYYTLGQAVQLPAAYFYNSETSRSYLRCVYRDAEGHERREWAYGRNINRYLPAGSVQVPEDQALEVEGRWQMERLLGKQRHSYAMSTTMENKSLVYACLDRYLEVKQIRDQKLDLFENLRKAAESTKLEIQVAQSRFLPSYPVRFWLPDPDQEGMMLRQDIALDLIKQKQEAAAACCCDRRKKTT